MTTTEIRSKIDHTNEMAKALKARIKAAEKVQNAFIDYCNAYAIAIDPEDIPLHSDKAWAESVLSRVNDDLKKLKKAERLSAELEKLTT